MQETQFYEWLLTKYPEKTANSRMSNCRRVERYEGSLDDHYSKDNGFSLISRLSYSAEDAQENRRAKHNIPIDGNIYNGTATFKQAVTLYFKFKNNVPSDPQKRENKKIKKDLRPIGDADKATPLAEQVIDFSKTAKEMAKQITGGNIEFIEFIDNTPLDKHFDRMIKQKLSQLLRGIIGQREEQLKLYELIDVAYNENSVHPRQ